MRAIIESPEDLGRVVQRLRRENRMSQRQLAEALGTSQRYVHELEAGKPKRADQRYFQILSMLGIRLTATTTNPEEAPDD